MRHLNATLTTLIALIFNSSPILAQEKPLAKTIEDACNAYNEKLKGYQISLTKSFHDYSSGEKSENWLKQTFKRHGEWKLYSNEVTKDRPGTGHRTVCRGVNSRYAFELTAEVGKPWRLREIDLNLGDGVQIAFIHEQMMGDRFIAGCTPFALGGVTFLPELLKRPGFSVTRDEALSGASRGMLRKITFQVAPDDVSRNTRGRLPVEGGGWIVFEPGRFWCVREMEIPFFSTAFKDPPFLGAGKFTYVDGENQFPLLQHVDVVYRARTDNKALSRTVLDFVIEKRTPTEDEFKLTTFGLAEPKLPERPSRFNKSYVWFSAIAIACFIAVLWLRRRQSGSA